mgnify:CR=1 FL=1
MLAITRPVASDGATAAVGALTIVGLSPGRWHRDGHDGLTPLFVQPDRDNPYEYGNPGNGAPRGAEAALRVRQGGDALERAPAAASGAQGSLFAESW